MAMAQSDVFSSRDRRENKKHPRPKLTTKPILFEPKVPDAIRMVFEENNMSGLNLFLEDHIFVS